MINEPLIQKSLGFIWVKQIHKPDQCDHFGLPQLDAYPDEIHQKTVLTARCLFKKDDVLWCDRCLTNLHHLVAVEKLADMFQANHV